MSQPQRTIEHLLKHGILSAKHADAAATHLKVYPNKQTWLAFFDKALLMIGSVALALALVFFIAYNWLSMGKMGKFALVEGALVITIALYVGLHFTRRFRQRFQLIRQLLLLIASIITGSLLALFGQIYQTGADTWQLFSAWALLITPWVMIARFPALWLLWLGLVNASLMLYLDVTGLRFLNHGFDNHFQMTALALVNVIAFCGWLMSIDNKRAASNHIKTSQTNTGLHWSTYVVGLVSTYFTTYLAIITVVNDGDMSATLVAIVLWLGWCAFMFWRFYQRHVDVLILTYLAFSIIIVVMFWVGKWVLDDFDESGFLVLALLVIGMSSAAVVWLRNVARNSSSKTLMVKRGADDE